MGLLERTTGIVTQTEAGIILSGGVGSYVTSILTSNPLVIGLVFLGIFLLLKSRRRR